MTQREKLYAERDAMELDEAGNYYIKHVMAMTSERLHSKSAIACELAYRDMLIDKLTKELQAAKAQAVPEGWKLVPIDPTQEMFDAAFHAPSVGHPETSGQSYGSIYKAMVSAAPEQNK